MRSFEKDPKTGDNCYTIRPAGWLARFAKVSVNVHRCGHIDDGISLDLSACEEPNKSQWYPGGVISFADLEAIYFAAKELRAGSSQTGKSGELK